MYLLLLPLHLSWGKTWTEQIFILMKTTLKLSDSFSDQLSLNCFRLRVQWTGICWRWKRFYSATLREQTVFFGSEDEIKLTQWIKFGLSSVSVSAALLLLKNEQTNVRFSSVELWSAQTIKQLFETKMSLCWSVRHTQRASQSDVFSGRRRWNRELIILQAAVISSLISWLYC